MCRFGRSIFNLLCNGFFFSSIHFGGSFIRASPIGVHVGCAKKSSFFWMKKKRKSVPFETSLRRDWMWFWDDVDHAS